MFDVALVRWLPVLSLGILALLARALSTSWLSAGPAYALTWFVYLALPLLFAPDYTVAPSGLWWITLCAAAVCTGGATVSYYFHRTAPLQCTLQDGRDDSSFPYLRRLLLFVVLCGILSSVVGLSDSGRSMTALFSGDAYMEMAHELSIERYTEESSASWMSRLLLTSVYLGPILGGMLFTVKRLRWDGYIALVSIVPALFIFVLHTTRAAFILAGILCVAGGLAGQVWRWQVTRRTWTPKVVAVSLGVVGLGVALFSLGQAVREGEAPGLDVLWNRTTSPGVRAAFFGHVSTFSQWFDSSWDSTVDPAWGRYSLAGLFDLLGLGVREAGLYRDIQEVEPGGLTNIYTVFRGLIQDFTLSGALVFLFLIGGIAQHAHHRTGQGRLAWMPVLIAFYAFTGDFITSIFNYNSIIFAWLLLALYVWGTCLYRSGFVQRGDVPT
jgi:oligosaccharide repeat unit polymerase